MTITRRDIAVGAAAAAATTAISTRATAQSYVDLNALSWSDFDRRAVSGILNQADPVALPGYRLGFVVRNGINSITTGGRYPPPWSRGARTFLQHRIAPTPAVARPPGTTRRVAPMARGVNAGRWRAGSMPADGARRR